MDELLLFNKWTLSDIEVEDAGLKRYINLRPIVIPHSSGRHTNQRFKKSELNIVERFANKLMRPGRNAGKKALVLNAMETAFELIYLKTNTNPVKVLVDAIQNAAPREEITRLSHGGVAQPQAVDVAPLRRVDISLRFLTEGITSSSYSSLKTFAEIIADEVSAAANNDAGSAGVRKKQELERIAYSAR